MRNNFKIIDSHCHLYPDSIAEKACISTGKFYDMTLKNVGKLEKLLELEKSAGIDHVLIQSVATTPNQVSSINKFIADVANNSNGYLIGLGTLHPDSDNIEQDINYIKTLGLKGIKLHADIQKIAIDDKRCFKIYDAVGDSLPILMHAGDSRFNFSNPENFLPVLNNFKKLQVIGAHFGGWSVWDEAGCKLSKFENFYVDSSSTLGFTGLEKMKKIMNRFSTDKILFGTDYPMWTPIDDVNAFFDMNLKQQEYDSIFYQNCKKLFNLNI